MARPGEWSVGQLYGGGKVNGLPVYTQPGGIGTRVIPQAPQQFPQNFQGYYQVPMTYPSLYTAGCGHAFNCFGTQQVYDPYDEVQVILLLCPICGYIQEIYSPASMYYDYVETPIVVG